MTTDGQLKMLKRLTNKEQVKEKEDSSDADITNKNKTLRGKKYDFIEKKIMKKCNSNDLGDLMVYCKNTVSKKKKKNKKKRILEN